MKSVDALSTASKARYADSVAVKDVAVVTRADLTVQGGEVGASYTIVSQRSVTAIAIHMAALADSSIVHILVSG